VSGLLTPWNPLPTAERVHVNIHAWLRCRSETSRIEHVNTAHLLPRMWELRATLSGYGSAYVAAAECYDCPLLTGDVRLARAPGLRCDVRLAVLAG